MVKLKEEFDYKSLARRLDIQLDKLIAEHERKQKGFEDEVERLKLDAKNRISDAERKCANVLEVSVLSNGVNFTEMTINHTMTTKSKKKLGIRALYPR